ncbi:serine/threonine-protein kinase [Streptomyces bicolor]|uniref:serine/threonine-protein kinase n=1 Tax=Streptomyces bicolor TaxID=66874 RepID=UPI0004E0BC49|nr:serine/threonine-protein kinase [Streptomyces bicolor]
MTSFDDTAGRVIAGRYRLLHQIGAGGMGRVWLAYDLDLACEVAVKEITFAQDLPESERVGRVARARQEARLAARLREHPHVATVHDVVEQNGLPYIVMAFVPGAMTLGEVVREQGPLDAAETARIGLAVLDALMAGHRIGILHRDIKPANILLTRPDHDTPLHRDPGQVLLADYGVALKPDSGAPRLTATSALVGTVGFLAPERARGAPPTAAADLFALGATLYFALSGNGPFDRDSEASTLTALLFEEPPVPDRAGALTPVLTGLLAKEPERRMTGEEAAELLAAAAEAEKEPKKEKDSKKGTATERIPTPVPPREETVVDSSGKDSPTGDETVIVPPRGGGDSGGAPPGDRQPKPQSPRRPSRSILIALVAVAALLVGGGLWAGASMIGGSDEEPAAERFTPTGQVKPYGKNVDLTKELRPGDCVSAVWGQGSLKGEPNSVGVVDCIKQSGSVDGQVIRTDVAVSLEDARENGAARCKSLLGKTVRRMADAQSYALVPNEEGWRIGVHSTACLLFNKSIGLYGPVGTFRDLGEEFFLTNASIGDCFNRKDAGDYFSIFLASCNTAHHEQVVGFVKAPAGLDETEGFEQAPKLCQNKYQSVSLPDGAEMQGWTSSEDWKTGFRYVMCTLYRPDGQKLTGDDVTSPVSLSSQALD